MSTAATTVATPRLLRQGIDAFRANGPAALVLWATGTAIVAGYYNVPAIRDSLDALAAFRQRVGLPYAAVATAIFCGLVPFAMQRVQRGGRRNFSPGYLVFLLAFWAYKGIEVDLLYQVQAWLWGEGTDPATIVAKTLVDQFVYCPILAVPGMALAFLWVNGGYRVAAVRQALRGRWYRRLVLPIMVPNWFFWIPAVVLIYLLPTGLQLPLQNIVACLWALMVMFMTADPAATGETAHALR